MPYNYWDLGRQQRGAVVEVVLKGSAANVFLVDSSNYELFKAGLRFRYYGGYANRSPFQVTVPIPGHWYLIIDGDSLTNRGTVLVRVLPGTR